MLESIKEYLQRECSDHTDFLLSLCEKGCLLFIAALWVGLFLAACAWVD